MRDNTPDDPLEQMLREAQSELSAAQHELSIAQDAVAKWEPIVAALEAASGGKPSAEVFAQRSYPKPADAIITVMKDHPGEPMKLKDIIRYIKENADYDPGLSGDNAYGTALGRLYKRQTLPIVSTKLGYMYTVDGGVPATIYEFKAPSPVPLAGIYSGGGS